MPDRPWAAGAGFATLVLALAGYYAMTELRYGNRLFGNVATLPALDLGAAGYIVFLALYGVITGV